MFFQKIIFQRVLRLPIVNTQRNFIIVLKFEHAQTQSLQKYLLNHTVLDKNCNRSLQAYMMQEYLASTRD